MRKTRKSQKGDGNMHIYSQSLKFNIRNDIDIFNEWLEPLSAEILNKKSRNIVITAACRPPKGNNKLIKDFCKDFLSSDYNGTRIHNHLVR